MGNPNHIINKSGNKSSIRLKIAFIAIKIYNSMKFNRWNSFSFSLDFDLQHQFSEYKKICKILTLKKIRCISAFWIYKRISCAFASFWKSAKFDENIRFVLLIFNSSTPKGISLVSARLKCKNKKVLPIKIVNF